MLAAPDWRVAASAQGTILALKSYREMPIRFVPQETLPAGIAYETFIGTTGQVPSRDNLHDFFNALVWLHFPLTKVGLNALQATELKSAAAVGNGCRGKIRDAATIFDENAAIFVARDPALVTALRTHNWSELFVNQRLGFCQEWEVWLFGHALLEKLAMPYKAITAHAWTLLADAEYFRLNGEEKRRWLDLKISDALAQGLVMTKLTPLPVAGLPGWWGGQDAEFYADITVFRPFRQRSKRKK